MFVLSFYTILESFDLFRSDVNVFSLWVRCTGRQRRVKKMLPFLHIFFHWFSFLLLLYSSFFLYMVCIPCIQSAMIHYTEHTALRNGETKINWWHTIYMCAYVMADRIQLTILFFLIFSFLSCGRTSTIYMQGTCFWLYERHRSAFSISTKIVFVREKSMLSYKRW